MFSVGGNTINDEGGMARDEERCNADFVFFEKCLRVFPRPGSDQEKYDEKRESDENEGEQEYGDTSFCDNHDCEMSSPVG